MKILEIKNIQKSWSSVKALDNISFDVPAGSIFGILGPKGSGKTTLIGIILHLIKSDGGSFSWFEEMPGTSMVKQFDLMEETPDFYQYISASLNLEITSMINRRGIPQEIDQVLNEINFHEHKASPFRTYKWGANRRVAIGAALQGTPTVIVLDEPINDLDPNDSAAICAMLLQLHKKGHTIIIASHILDEVAKICTHVAIIANGTLLTSGAVDQAFLKENQLN